MCVERIKLPFVTRGNQASDTGFCVLRSQGNKEKTALQNYLKIFWKKLVRILRILRISSGAILHVDNLNN